MNERYPVASTASLIADVSRAAMLTALLSGQALTAGELSRTANISAQSASMHLAQLLQGGLVQVAPQGRHRYYRLASPAVAHAVEALGTISTVSVPKPAQANNPLRHARTCYDHLAGELAIRMMDAFEKQKLLTPDGERACKLTAKGEAFFANWQIDIEALSSRRRSLARRCLDWTERRDHLAGALGAAICQRFFDAHWIVRDRNTRAVHLTPRGRQGLEPVLNP